jgi:hypothetical protein
MSQTDYAGIDYGLGQYNKDKETGIRYGVISQHSVPLEYQDDFEQDYGKPTCPKCGNPVITVEEFDAKYPDVELETSDYGCADFACKDCAVMLDSSEVYSEESQGFTYDKDGYQLTDCLDADIFVLKSPYYTHAQFCSPCVPGAGNLDSECADGPKTYCLGHEWFEDGVAPYKVYKVGLDSEVLPDTRDSAV